MFTISSIIVGLLSSIIIIAPVLIINRNRNKRIKELESRFKKPVNFQVNEKKIHKVKLQSIAPKHHEKEAKHELTYRLCEELVKTNFVHFTVRDVPKFNHVQDENIVIEGFVNVVI